MGKKGLFLALTLYVILTGSLFAGSKGVLRPVQGLSAHDFQSELQRFYGSFLSDAQDANQIRNALEGNLTLSGYSVSQFSSLRQWNDTIFQLYGELNDIWKDAGLLPYNAFTMDMLLNKTDTALITELSAESSLTQFFNFLQTQVAPTLPTSNATAWALILTLSVNLSRQTAAIRSDVMTIGFLFSKAKLEFLERPRLVCSPKTVALGKTVSCSGSYFTPGSDTTIVLVNEQTGGKLVLNGPRVDSFFDVFFDLSMAPSIGTGFIDLTLMDASGRNDTVTLNVTGTTTSLDIVQPSTIIPLSVLITAIITLAVASRRARRPV